MIQLFEYKESPIQFEMIEGQVMANATLMCKAFGKRPVDWLKLESTKEYIEALKKNSNTGKNGISENQGIANVRKNHISNNQIVTIKQGSAINGGGTWIDQHLIIPLTRWLDVDFSIWCDIKVAELLRTGVTSVDGKFARAMDAITSLTEIMKTSVTSLQTQINEMRSTQPSKSKPAKHQVSSDIIDARHRTYQTTEINGGQVRCIKLDDKNYYLMADVLILQGCRTSTGQYAATLNRSGARMAVKIWLFAQPREAWFVSEEGLKLLLSR